MTPISKVKLCGRSAGVSVMWVSASFPSPAELSEFIVAARLTMVEKASVCSSKIDSSADIELDSQSFPTIFRIRKFVAARIS